ncbi:MAG TPA: hypothetical protein VN654_02350 [Vicinamibacterales bacterium]|jgi:hypothetical protein|nr:hypothetical protein [Vicinamibacterales bacterium]
MLLVIGIMSAVVTLARFWARRNQDGDLGTVSHHWIAERRLGQGENSQR